MKRFFTNAFLTSAVFALALAVSTSASIAEEETEDGTLNPDEMTLNRSFNMAKRGEVNMVICAQGYLMVKKGDHAAAREIFQKCADKGYTGAMTWMSYMEQNGNGRPEDPAEAAEWDRKAAEAGDAIGMFNYGLDHLRGYGVAPDEEKGRQYIDRAAALGLQDARRLQKGGYDYREVTPDADEWKFKKHLY